MTINDLKELLEYIMKNNSWKEMSYYYCNRKQPKYLDIKLNFTLDTRDGIIFYISACIEFLKHHELEEKND